jgi:uncharacterized protein (DUF58 family)
VVLGSEASPMTPHRKTRFIRETVSYAFGVGAVATIALVREVNLLVFITGLLFVPLIINSYLARASLWKVSYRRKLPEGVCAGESSVVEIEVDHPKKMGAAWTLMLRDQFQLMEPASLAKLDRPMSVSVLAKSKEPYLVKAAYRIVATRRGRYRFGPLEASTRYPLGFVESRVQWLAEEDWLVLPRLGVLLPQWRVEVETHRQGEQKSHSRRGFIEGEYHGLRQWRDGDSRRWIHWRTSARTGRLMVRQFERQQNQDLILLIDLWRQPNGDLADAAAVELAISFAATIVDDLCRQGAHRLCIYVNSKKPLLWSGVTSQIALAEILAELAVVEATEDPAEAEFPREFRSYAIDGTPVLRVTTRKTGEMDPPIATESRFDRSIDLGDQAFELNVRRGDLTPYFADRDAL